MLDGFTFCCTGVKKELKDSIVEKCKSMGADHQDDLTQDAHFLLVGDQESHKYAFAAKSRLDITFLHPQFVEHLHAQWIAGDEVDLDAVVHEFRLPAFYGQILSTSNISERAPLVELIHEAGGVFDGYVNARKTNILVTPLAKGNKYEFARKKGIPVVHPRWIEDSVRRGAMLELQPYHPRQPEERLGLGAVECEGGVWEVHPTPWKLAERVVEDQEKLFRRPKLRQTDLVTSLWNRLTQEPVAMSTQDESASESAVSEPKPAKSTAKEPTPEPKQKPMFEGRKFMFAGFIKAQMKKLVTCVESHGATVVGSESQATEIIVHVELPPDRYDSLITSCDTPIHTFWLIERSIYQKKFTKDVWSSYVPEKDLVGFADINICITGFSGVELLHVEKLISMVGARYLTIFSEKTASVLIAGSEAARKVQKAHKWQVPVVSIEWLWDSAVTSKVMDVDRYIMGSKTYLAMRRFDTKGVLVGGEQQPQGQQGQQQSLQRPGQVATTALTRKRRRLSRSTSLLDRLKDSVDTGVDEIESPAAEFKRIKSPLSPFGSFQQRLSPRKQGSLHVVSSFGSTATKSGPSSPFGSPATAATKLVVSTEKFSRVGSNSGHLEELMGYTATVEAEESSQRVMCDDV